MLRFIWGKSYMSILHKFFSLKIEKSCKVITFLGVKFRLSGWPIRSNRYNTGFKLPAFVPIKIRDDLISLDAINKYLRYEGYDWDSENFKSDYKKLISGLDEASIKTVTPIIESYKTYFRLTKKAQVTPEDVRNLNTLLSPPEKERESLYKNFTAKICYLGHGIFRYKNYLLPVNHFESSVFLHRHCIDELQTLDKIKQKNIIDVGGFIADSAIVFSEYTDKRVYTFEASDRNFELMKRTLDLNKLDNIIPVKSALGAISGKRLCLCDSGSCTRIADVNSRSNTVNHEFAKSITLDDYVNDNKLEVGLIKVDIEGFEQQFLKGAENTIKTQKPALLISIYHNPDDYLHIKPVIESWNLGYKFRIICPPENRLLETLLVAEVL